MDLSILFMKTKQANYLLASLVFIAFGWFVIAQQRTPLDLSILLPYRASFISGFYNTIIVSVIALIGSVVLGFILFILSTTKILFFRAFTDILTEIVYGTPLLVMIIVMAFVIGPAFNTFNRNVMGVTGLIVYIAPYMTNIFKSAFSSISDDQYMAMDLFGFSSYQRYRYLIIPQVIRGLMPPLMNNFSLIIKGSALLNVVSYRELFYRAEGITSETFAFVEVYLVMWGMYLLITIPLSQLTRYIERRWAI